MEVLWLRVRAPFAAFRPLAAGVFRGTTRTIAHSTAYGLLLNLAAIESRASEVTAVTGKRGGLPRLQIAVGECREPEVAVLYQQLHGYPVGNSSAEFKERARGAKYHIAPARRELLVGLDVVLGVRPVADAGGVLDRAVRGLHGEFDAPRYGLPFAGDNNLLFDRIDVLAEPIDARWYTPVHPGAAPREGTVRLTSAIDRDDSSRTRAGLFAPIETATTTVPDDAWVLTE